MDRRDDTRPVWWWEIPSNLVVKPLGLVWDGQKWIDGPYPYLEGRDAEVPM